MKLGVAAGCVVPGTLGQIVSGFMTFSAVMLLKCLMSSAESVASVSDEGCDGRAHRIVDHAESPGDRRS